MKKINILSILSLIVFLLFNILLFKLNILPTKYLAIILIILVIINIIGITLINLNKKIFKVIGIIILLIYMFLSVIGTYYLHSTNNFLDKSFKNKTNTVTNTYYIVTYKDNESNNKKDIKDNIYYYESSINIDSAIKKAKEKVNVQYESYTSLSTLIKDLNDHKINFILLDKSSYDVIFNIDENLDKNNFKIIYKFNIKTKKSTTNNSNKIKDSFNIYIGGTDFDNLMDFNMIVTINMKTHKVLLTSIPRDYYIEEYNTGGKKDTLSFMGVNGIETNLKSIENFFDIDIDYYININTKSLVGIVDEIGGITYCSEFSFTTTHALVLDTYDDTKGKKLYVKKGCQRLNGIQTLTVARERKAFPGSDRLRQKHCQKIMIAIFDELKNINTITNYNNILNSLSNLYVTDISKEEITYIIKDTINGAQWEILEQSVDGSDGYDYVHLTDLKSYVMYPNMDTVNTAKEQINDILK